MKFLEIFITYREVTRFYLGGRKGMSVMAMTILNNTASMMTLGELNKNITKVGKDLNKISKGERLPNFASGASDVAISEKMRVQIRGLAQDERNVQNGSSLLRTAEGGMQEIVDELRNLKELALNSCNDHNTDADRAIIQKEVNQKIANIEDIASTTNYNGRLLLDGTWRMPFKELTQIKIPETHTYFHEEWTTKQTGTKSIQVTGGVPSVTKIKDITTGNTILRQDNYLKDLSANFSPLYKSCDKGDVVSYAGFLCDTGFMGKVNTWAWGEEYEATKFPNATPINAIRDFNQSLNDSALTGTDALDEAVVSSSNGVFSSFASLQKRFMEDVNSHASRGDFLTSCCNIVLYNKDTGAITGLDAKTSDQPKTAESIVPEYTTPNTWGLPTPGGTTAFNGLTVHWPTVGVNGAFTNAENAILKGLNSEWTQNCLDLIQESFSLNFEDSNTTVKDIDVKFVNNNDTSLAFVESEIDSNGVTNKLTLNVNMKYYEGIVASDPNGKTTTSGAGYLDRTLAHEFTHAAMSANINHFEMLPDYIQEGMAEIVHGIDDERLKTIEYFASSNGPSYLDNMINDTPITDTTKTAEEIEKLQAQLPYAGGYIFLRYMAEQSSNLFSSPPAISGKNQQSYSYNGQMGIDIDFSQFQNEVIPDVFDQQGFSILCAGCPQFINFTFDKNIEPENSTFVRNTEDPSRSDYVIGIKGVTDVEGIEEAIFKGAAATDFDERKHGSSYEKDIYINKYDDNGDDVSEIASVVLDGRHGVRIAKKPDDSGYMFIKDYGPNLGFLDSGIVLAVEEAGTTDDLPPGVIDENGNEVIPITGPTEINLTTPTYDEEVKLTPYEVITYRYEEELQERKGNPLYIHTGTKSNIDIALFINDMRAPALGVDKVNLSTRQQASDSLDIIDSSLQYALDEVTRVGAYQSRLEFTRDNIVTANENTQAAESTIRDADMAKEMTSFTKNNILMQASQAMMSQANQNASGVLGLLQ